jgi:glutamate 5-kinase
MTRPAPSRIVVKVGTSTLTDPHGRIDRAFIADLAAQLAAQRAAGRDVLLVTSGAIRAGQEKLDAGARGRGDAGTPPSAPPLRRGGIGGGVPRDVLPFKQAAAAVGQGLLMHTYTEAFAWRSVTVAQVLLTRDDLADRRRFLNARNTLTALLALGVVPIINENDTVAVEEIKFGDNDTLAALVAVLVEADLLLILSDVEGLYETPSPAPPFTRGRITNASPFAKGGTGEGVIRTVSRIDAQIEALAGEAFGGVGTGGMRTKVEAARIATASGIRTVIAQGRRERVVAEAVAGEEVGTTFLPRSTARRLRGRKRWIAAGSRPRGSVTVNARAAERLRREGVSLLAVGITAVIGEFDAGDLIEVRDEANRRCARGLTNYGADELRRIMGLRSDRFEAVLGCKTYDEVIHRDNLVVEG